MSHKVYFDILSRLGVAHECDRPTDGQVTVSNTVGWVLLPLPSGWTTSSAEAVHQLRPNAQLRHNLGKSISSSYELERTHNFHRIKS